MRLNDSAPTPLSAFGAKKGEKLIIETRTLFTRSEERVDKRSDVGVSKIIYNS